MDDQMQLDEAPMTTQNEWDFDDDWFSHGTRDASADVELSATVQGNPDYAAYWNTILNVDPLAFSKHRRSKQNLACPVLAPDVHKSGFLNRYLLSQVSPSGRIVVYPQTLNDLGLGDDQAQQQQESIVIDTLEVLTTFLRSLACGSLPLTALKWHTMHPLLYRSLYVEILPAFRLDNSFFHYYRDFDFLNTLSSLPEHLENSWKGFVADNIRFIQTWNPDTESPKDLTPDVGLALAFKTFPVPPPECSFDAHPFWGKVDLKVAHSLWSLISTVSLSARVAKEQIGLLPYSVHVFKSMCKERQPTFGKKKFTYAEQVGDVATSTVFKVWSGKFMVDASNEEEALRCLLSMGEDKSIPKRPRSRFRKWARNLREATFKIKRANAMAALQSWTPFADLRVESQDDIPTFVDPTAKIRWFIQR
ncbi:hypothetical protein HDV05_000362, partial [Chytridiales sp. JEL 0842]